MAVSPRQLSMSEMMAMASEAGNNISEGVKKSEGGMKMPAGIPKVGKMPDWVKKRIEARKKAGSGREKSGDAGSSGGRKRICTGGWGD